MIAADTHFTAPASTHRTGRAFARRMPTGARALLGLMFFVSGLDGFLHFMGTPDPSTIPAGALAFGIAMMKTGYLFHLVKGTEVVVGTLLLANRLVPLALVVIAPVIVNIALFHAFLAPDGLPLVIGVVALEVYLAWSYRNAYRAMLAFCATPGAR